MDKSTNSPANKGATDSDDQVVELIRARHQHVQDAELALQKTVVSLRTAGATWATIGKGLGVSRQAAQRKYGWIRIWRG